VRDVFFVKGKEKKKAASLKERDAAEEATKDGFSIVEIETALEKEKIVE